MFASKDYTAGQLNAIIAKMKRQYGDDAPEKFLRDELEVIEKHLEKSWTEENGIIRFSVTSNGMTGEEWINHFNAKGIKMSDEAKFILKSKDFKDQVTEGVTTQITVLKGELFSDSERTTENIRKKGSEMNLSDPNPEVACLIRDKFTDEELKQMGLYWIVTMHQPISDRDGFPCLLRANRGDGSWLVARWDRPGRQWGRDVGFAFSQVS